MLRRVLIALAVAASVVGLAAIALAKKYDDIKWASRTFIRFTNEDKLEAFIKAADLVDPHSYNVQSTPLVLQIINSEVLEALSAEVYEYKLLDQEEVNQTVRKDMRATSEMVSWVNE